MEVWSTSYSSRQGDRAGESDSVSSHDRGGGRGGEENEDWLCGDWSCRKLQVILVLPITGPPGSLTAATTGPP